MHQCNAHNINDAPRLMHLGAFITLCYIQFLLTATVHVLSSYSTLQTCFLAHTVHTCVHCLLAIAVHYSVPHHSTCDPYSVVTFV